MANYTIELKDIVDTGIPIFDFKYPFYDEEKRAEFERDFIRHFYFREIGAETVDRFKLYLEDKFATVFPYYNKLFETALVNYDLVNNYDVTESHEITRESKDKANGISSTVARGYGTHTAETEETRTGENNQTQTETATDAENETTTETVTGEKSGDSKSTGKTTSNSTTESTRSENENTNSEKVTKFLDTPQGAVDFSNAKYLTTLTGDSENAEKEGESSESASATGSGTTEGTSETSETSETESLRTRNLSRNATNENVVNGSESSESKSNILATDEQKKTEDNNTRTESVGEQKEIFSRRMYGNIGVQTATDMLEKHIIYQKTVSNIKKMFFDECEDLFMMVY